MTTIHPPVELIVDYCTATLSEGISLAVETHLAMCAKCRLAERRIMNVGGALLEEIDVVSVEPNSLETVFSIIDRASMPGLRHRAAAGRGESADLPAPLRRYLPNGLAGCTWKKVGPWFEETRLKVSSSARVSLMRLRPGSLMPRHTHRGQEITVVLAGGYTDNGVKCGPGDFSLNDAADNHQPGVDDDETCLCLVVLEAPVRLTGRLGQLANMLIWPQ
jgi:putative transcriptional regulator